MLQWIKTHKNMIIGGGIILLVLIAAFLLGGPIQPASEPGEKETASASGSAVSSEPDSSSRSTERTTERNTQEEEREGSSRNGQTASEEGKDAPGTEEQPSHASGSSEAREPDTATVPEATEAPAAEAAQAVTFSCTISITCEAVLEHLDAMEPAKAELVPAGGSILSTTTVTVTEGESVYDVLRRVCTNAGIPLDASITPGYGSAYVRGIQNIYEFDCGSLSGWKYRVNGIVPNYGCSSYILQEGDNIQFYFTTDLNS